MHSNWGSLAQLVEQLAFNQLVAGSSPARPTTYSEKAEEKSSAFFLLLRQALHLHALFISDEPA